MQARLLIADRMASVGTLAAGVAHEINNPLTYVMANISYAIEQLKGMQTGRQRTADTQVTELLQALRESLQGAHRVSHIVGDLKTFSRSDEDTVAPVELSAVVESSLNITHNEIRHRATLVKDFREAPRVLANESRLGQVFINLLVNAVHALPADDPAGNEVRVTIRTLNDGRAAVEIADTGCGMPPHTLKRLFDPFYTTKPVGKGTGLGLSICHSIVDGLGGDIVVESQVGKGSLFRVVLPSAAGVVSGATPQVEAEVAPRRGRVLVIDDEPDVGAVVKRVLAAEHEVVISASGGEALEQIAAGPTFDVILCDLMMPEMSGMEFYRELKRTSPEHVDRVSFITGGAFTEAAADFVDALPNRVLEKPFAPEVIRQLVGERLRQIDAERGSEDALAS
jgi:CheY-like chemotaxis protein/two-component sensor histidine kinase